KGVFFALEGVQSPERIRPRLIFCEQGQIELFHRDLGGNRSKGSEMISIRMRNEYGGEGVDPGATEKGEKIVLLISRIVYKPLVAGSAEKAGIPLAHVEEENPKGGRFLSWARHLDARCQIAAA